MFQLKVRISIARHWLSQERCMTERSKGFTRRQLLVSSATSIAVGAAASAGAATVVGVPQWVPFDHNGPLPQDRLEPFRYRLRPHDRGSRTLLATLERRRPDGPGHAFIRLEPVG